MHNRYTLIIEHVSKVFCKRMVQNRKTLLVFQLLEIRIAKYFFRFLCRKKCTNWTGKYAGSLLMSMIFALSFYFSALTADISNVLHLNATFRVSQNNGYIKTFPFVVLRTSLECRMFWMQVRK